MLLAKDRVDYLQFEGKFKRVDTLDVVHLMLEHTRREVQQLHVCIHKLLLSLVTHHNLLRPRNQQFYSWIPAAFLPFL